MKMQPLVLAIAVGLGTFGISFTTMAATPLDQVQSYEFMYQGYLEQNGSPANGNFDLEFSLWDASSGGAQFGSPILEPSWPIADGRFSINLAWPGAFNGTQRWIQVKINGTTLPRQLVGSTSTSEAKVGLPVRGLAKL